MIDLRTLRKSARLTQQHAARLVGVSVRTWRNWEHEVTAMPYASQQLFKQHARRRTKK